MIILIHAQSIHIIIHKNYVISDNIINAVQISRKCTLIKVTILILRGILCRQGSCIILDLDVAERFSLPLKEVTFRSQALTFTTSCRQP